MDPLRTSEPSKIARRLVVLHAAIGAGWLVLARSVVPALLASAYRGRSGLPPLDRWVRGRFHRHLDHYQGLWLDFSDSVLLALGLHLGLVLLALRWARGSGGSAPDPGHRLSSWALLCLPGAFLGLAVLSGPRQDYPAYLEIWSAVVRGRDPWAVDPRLGYSTNAYGPLFVALTPLARANMMAPKLLFASSYVVAILALARPPLGRSPRRLALAMAPFFWVEIAYFGHFDVLVALACVAAVSARLRGWDGASGAGLASGFLLKFIPVALLPFLALEGLRVRVRLLVVASLLMGAGMGLAYLAWGPSALRPLGFAYGRGSSFASIFRFLRGPYSPTRAFGGDGNVDWLSVPCLLGFGLATLATGQVLRFRADTSSVLAALVVTAFYQVGFLQYQVVPVLLLLAWIRGNERAWAENPPLRWAAFAHVAWLSALDLLVCWGGGVIHPEDPLGWLEDVVGLPTFLLSVLLWLALARAGRGAVP